MTKKIALLVLGFIVFLVAPAFAQTPEELEARADAILALGFSDQLAPMPATSPTGVNWLLADNTTPSSVPKDQGMASPGKKEDSRKQLTGEEILRFEGKTFSSQNGRKQDYWMKLGPPDGTTKVWVFATSSNGGEINKDQAVWRVVGSQFCLKYQTWQNGIETCSDLFSKDGELQWPGGRSISVK